MQNKDKNNFIVLILNSIICSTYFHKKIRLAITNRTILKFIKLRFYLRKRFNKTYLYTRILKSGFGNNENLKIFLDDLKLLIPELEIETTQGHYKGLIIDTINKEALILYLSVLSLLSRPDDFLLRKSKIFYSYYNKIDSSKIPIHFRFIKKKIDNLKTIELQNVFKNNIQLYNDFNNSSDDECTSILNDFTRTIQVDS